MLSPMQLKDFVVQLLHVEANPKFAPQKRDHLEDKLECSFGMMERKDPRLYRINLDVSINGKDEDFAKRAYRIHVVVYAIYEFDLKMPKEDIDKLLGPNGLAMAYSIARGVVANATGTSLHGKYILPTVNFVELLKEKASRQGKKEKGAKTLRKTESRKKG